MLEASKVLKELEHPTNKRSWMNEKQEGAIWGKAKLENDSIYNFQSRNIDTDFVPNVCGMGAKDAVFLMQQCGLDVELKGYGTVKSQSIVAGTRIKGHRSVRLTLAP